MTKKRYEELLKTKHPFIYSETEAEQMEYVAVLNPEWAEKIKEVFTRGRELEKRENKNKIEWNYKVQITPEEADRLEYVIRWERLMERLPLHELNNIVKRLDVFTHKYHPNWIRERENKARRESRIIERS